MAKGNNKKVKNPDPMSNSKTMAREGMKIIRNIAFGTFNVYTEGHVFRNLEFTQATLAEVDKRLLDASIHLTALRYAYANSTDPNVLSLIHRDQKIYDAYNLIHETLGSIIVTGGDTGFLYVLINKLPQYKYNI